MSATKLKIAAAVIAVGIAAVITVQRNANQRLQTENEQLRGQAAELQTLRDQSAQWKNASGGADRPSAKQERYTAEHSELMKLRGEVSLLRRQVQAAPPPTARAGNPPFGANADLVLENQRLRADLEKLGGLMQTAEIKNSRSACINTLRQMDGAKAQWALENRKVDTDTVTLKDIAPYLKGSVIPTCPDGGTYAVSLVMTAPTCSIPGHSLLEPNDQTH